MKWNKCIVIFVNELVGWEKQQLLPSAWEKNDLSFVTREVIP